MPTGCIVFVTILVGFYTGCIVFLAILHRFDFLNPINYSWNTIDCIINDAAIFGGHFSSKWGKILVVCTGGGKIITELLVNIQTCEPYLFMGIGEKNCVDYFRLLFLPGFHARAPSIN